MKLYTLGFTKKSAKTFFEILRDSRAASLVDVRLNNVSQLAGFTKREDLSYFLRELCNISYSHETLLAPTQEMLSDYKKHGLSWSEYESRFRTLIVERKIEQVFSIESLDNSVLLCSEPKPHNCHRRLVAEHLRDHWERVNIVHLG